MAILTERSLELVTIPHEQRNVVQDVDVEAATGVDRPSPLPCTGIHPLATVQRSLVGLSSTPNLDFGLPQYAAKDPSPAARVSPSIDDRYNKELHQSSTTRSDTASKRSAALKAVSNVCQCGCKPELKYPAEALYVSFATTMFVSALVLSATYQREVVANPVHFSVVMRGMLGLGLLMAAICLLLRTKPKEVCWKQWIWIVATLMYFVGSLSVIGLDMVQLKLLGYFN